MKLADGSVAQPGFGRQPAQATFGQQTAHPFPEVGVVTATYPRDAEGNVSGAYVEVDVLLLRHYVTLRNVPLGALNAGTDDGQAWTPRPCSVNVRTVTDDVERRGALDELDGDLVLVAFIGGYSPIVVCGVPRALAAGGGRAYEPSESEGRVYRVRHRGTTIEVDDDGNATIDVPGGAGVTLRRGDASVTVTSGEDVVVNVPTIGGQVSFRIGGAVVGTVKSVLGIPQVQLGDVEDGLLLTELATREFVQGIYDTHTHGPGTYANPGGAVVGVSDLPVPLSTSVPTSITGGVRARRGP